MPTSGASRKPAIGSPFGGRRKRLEAASVAGLSVLGDERTLAYVMTPGLLSLEADVGLWRVGIAHLYIDHRSQLRIDPSVGLQMADEARKLGRYRIAVAIFVRVAQRGGFLDLGFNSVAFRYRQCRLYRLDQCDRGGDGVSALGAKLVDHLLRIAGSARSCRKKQNQRDF